MPQTADVPCNEFHHESSGASNNELVLHSESLPCVLVLTNYRVSPIIRQCRILIFALTEASELIYGRYIIFSLHNLT